MGELPNNKISPANMSVKEAFKSQFDSAISLQTQMMAAMSAVMDDIGSIPLPKSFVDSILGDSANAFEITTYTPTEYLKSVDPATRMPIYTTDPNEAVNLNFFRRKTSIKPNTSIKTTIKSMKDTIDNYSIIEVSYLAVGVPNPVLVVIIQSIGASLREDKARIELLERKIKWYEKYTNESVFDNNEYLGTYKRNDDAQPNPMPVDLFAYDKQLARILLPVDFGYKKKKKKIAGGLSVTIKENIGIRWVEMLFIDSAVLDNHRPSTSIPGKKQTINKPITVINTNNTTLNSDIEVTIQVPNHGIALTTKNLTVTISGYSTSWLIGTHPAYLIDSQTIKYYTTVTEPGTGNTGGILVSVIIPPPATQKTDKKTPVRIEYTMAHLPPDGEISKKSFQLFGPFDQSKYASRSRGTNATITNNGFEIFPSSSKELSSMRSGIDVYNKVAFLMKALINEFGESRVKLIECSRSVQDQ
ncbi:MAG: hypothetical protein WCO84_10015, partial [bacterium]